MSNKDYYINSIEENKKNITHYYTPYGSLLIGIDAKQVSIEEKEDFMEIKVAYALELNQEHTADCDIKITVQSKNSGKFRVL